MADFALTVLGNSLGALLTAALAAARGIDTCLVLAGHEGFDDSFHARDIFLEGGLLLSDATNPAGPVQLAVQELGLALDPIPIDTPITFHTDLGAVRLGPDFQTLTTDFAVRFPEDRGALAHLAASLQDWWERWEAGAPARGFTDPNPRAWSHATIRELSLTGTYHFSRRWFPQRRLAALARTSFAAVLDALNFAPAHRAWWEALLVLRTGHLPLALDCLTVAQTLGRDVRGLSAVSGGLDGLRRQIVNGINARPHCAVMRGTIEQCRFTPEAPVTVQVADAGSWTTEQLVCDRGPLMWQAHGAGVDVLLKPIPGAQRHPHVVGVLVALRGDLWRPEPSGQQWWVPRLELPPTGPNGFWITHLPEGANLPNPPGIHLATVHGAYLESQLLDPAERLYSAEDLVRRLFATAQARDPRLQMPMEAFRPALPLRVAPLSQSQTLLPDPRAAVEAYTQNHRLGAVPRCWWLDRTLHPPQDLRMEFVLARQMVEQVLALSPVETVMREVREILAPLKALPSESEKTT